jgi:MoaA/NifB/PqqE/SkfB family radical SAM enzyme
MPRKLFLFRKRVCKIDTIILSITDACPLMCMGCYATKDMPVMGFDRFKFIIDRLPRDTKSITLTGGEPFSHPQLRDMVKYCANTFMKPRIVTSGYMNPNLLLYIKDDIELLIVTVKYLEDGLDSRWRKGENTFNKSLAFLQKGKELGIPLSINWIADNQNNVHFFKMQRFASLLGATLQVVRFIPYNDALKPFSLKDEFWEDLCMQSCKFTNTHIGFPSEYAANHVDSSKKPFGYIYCTGGINRLYIRTDGSVTPCIYVHEKIADFKTQGYEDIERLGEEWRILHLTHNGKKIRGCIGFLKALNPEYQKMAFDKMNVLKIMQMRGAK